MKTFSLPTYETGLKSLGTDLSETTIMKPSQKSKCRPVLSVRAHEDMARDIQAEAKKRKLRLSEEIRRRLEFYAAHKKMLEAS